MARFSLQIKLLIVACLLLGLALVTKAWVDGTLTLPFLPQNADSPDEPQGYFAPEPREPTPERIASLKLPPGFQVSVFVTGLKHPDMLTVAPQGRLYVSRPREHDIVLVQDTNGDGKADRVQPVADHLPEVSGVAYSDNALYYATTHVLYRAPVLADGRLGRAQVLIDNLPEGGQHPYRFVTVSPDGWVYVVVGSYWNAAPEPTLDHAAVLRIRPDGTERQRVATGLRHMVGIDWHPETNEIWGMDQGADWHMMDIPPEELNRIRPGAHYGYPWCYGQRQPDPLIQQHPPHTTQEAFCAQTEPSAMVYQAHSSPTGFLFYRGTQFPPAYRNDAYVTLLGSTHRKEPVGFKLIRIHYDEAGKPVSISDFLSGFLTEEGKAEFGRPAGLAQWPDGSLLMSDTGHGVIYRITYSGSAS